jgi:hypothetical protein
MNEPRLTIDRYIRQVANWMIIVFGVGFVGVGCVFAVLPGTKSAFAFAAVFFLCGFCVVFALSYLATYPERLEKYVPGPPVLGKILVRIPTYPCAFLLPVYLLFLLYVEFAGF